MTQNGKKPKKTLLLNNYLRDKNFSEQSEIVALSKTAEQENTLETAENPFTQKRRVSSSTERQRRLSKDSI